MTDLQLPGRFYSAEETPDICRDLHRAGLHNLADFVTSLMDELEETRTELENTAEELDDSKGGEDEAEGKVEQFVRVRESLTKRLQTLPNPPEAKEHRQLLADVLEALEFID